MKRPTAQYKNNCDRVVVVGGGPAGMMAAVSAAAKGAKVLLLEKNDRLGIKLNITGKGRCNITNNCSPQTVIQNTPRNGKFLYSSLNRFSPSDVYDFFERNGLKLKVERGNRVFPASDRAKDVSELMRSLMKEHGVQTLKCKVKDIVILGDGYFDILTDNNETIRCKATILATGGMSYPRTGSTGDGYRMAKNLGHTIISPKPSIVPLESPDPDCVEMQGLSLKNVGVKATDSNGKLVYKDFGELMFTHFGITGPTVLSMSAHLRDFENSRYTVSIDFKPALDHKKLDERILRDFEKYSNKIFRNSLGDLLPGKAILPVIRRSGIDPFKPVHSVERKERHALLNVLKDFRIQITGTRPIEEAVVTSGGVDTSEINPQTMGSKLVKGLFFAGEIIDVDAYTGGFNLQIAWSTGYSAGIASAEYCTSPEDRS
ncbi:MAG: NAD(P)/FAD-dependent oxidoreductase [Eubacteriales bacterium]|jgi:predicted Rossmann fold flavoprotein